MYCGDKNHCWDKTKTAVAIYIADPEQCVKEKCPGEYKACQVDPKCGPALEDCQKKCGTKESCWKLCLAGKGDKAADNVAKCAA